MAELTEAVGRPLPTARVACLCFDKLDVEKGMEVRSPAGERRTLKRPWSVLAYQVAGDEGLRLLHAEGLAEERERAPAENLLTELLERPGGEGLGTLVLIDEVLMYAREKVAADGRWKDRLINFFQYLTQAATKVDRCCVVASLLASDPVRTDSFGRRLQGELYDIFQRQREEAVELEPSQLQDLADFLPGLLEIKAKADIPLRLRVQLELGDGAEPPPEDAVAQINGILEKLKDGFRLE